MTLRDLVALSLAPGAPARKAAALDLAVSEPAASAAESPLELLLECCCPPDAPPALAGPLRLDADAALARAAAAGIRPLPRTDPAYPEALTYLSDAPVLLWVTGDAALLSGRLVAIVGSRAASSYGLEVAERLGFDLARAGVTVVSGMARGCDGAAHRGALDAGGRTVAVLGCGADVAYPAEHRGMLRAVRASGAVVSEYAPGTPPRSWMFPLRNRIISGLSRAVVVVEASAKSGSLITAACALEQGRDVMAVPGGVFGERHRGCHALLRDGARLVQSAADVLDELGWSPTPPGPIDTPTPGAGDGWLAPGEACDLDTLAARAGLAPGAVLSTLSQLELAGSVRRGAGGVFIRVRRQ